MTTSSRRRASVALGGLALATTLFCVLFEGRGMVASHTVAHAAAQAQSPTPTPTPNPYPTAPSYFCPEQDVPMYFKWTRRMPGNGWLGTVGSLAIQVYDPKPLSGGGTSWGFQPQNGGFACRLEVSSDKDFISYEGCRQDRWPYTYCQLLVQK